MSSPNSVGQISIPVGEQGLEARAVFITQAYNHLMGAIVAFVGVEFLLFGSGAAETIASFMLSGSWLLILGGFMVIGYLASSVAARSVSKSSQYAALAAYVVAEAIIFVPMLYIAGLVRYGFILALVAIVAGLLFGFQLGTWFSVGMVGLAGAAILYETSNVLHHYPEDRYVAASLALFSSVALLFWYVLRIFMSSGD